MQACGKFMGYYVPANIVLTLDEVKYKRIMSNDWASCPVDMYGRMPCDTHNCSKCIIVTNMYDSVEHKTKFALFIKSILGDKTSCSNLKVELGEPFEV